MSFLFFLDQEFYPLESTVCWKDSDIQQNYQRYLSYYLYQFSLLQVAGKGLTTPLSRWLQGSSLYVQVLGDLRVVSYWIDTLVLKN